jgi:hypothetical protein
MDVLLRHDDIGTGLVTGLGLVITTADPVASAPAAVTFWL